MSHPLIRRQQKQPNNDDFCREENVFVLVSAESDYEVDCVSLDITKEHSLHGRIYIALVAVEIADLVLPAIILRVVTHN